MKIGILGSGTVALALGEAWAAKGHAVFIGARHSQKPTLKALLQRNQNIQTGALAQAATFGDVVLLAVNPWGEIAAVLHPLQGVLAGKILIDVSNNITFGDKPTLAFRDKSMGEYVQESVPQTHVIKTLNITPAAMMTDPHQSGINPAVGWVAGNNADAKQLVSGLVKDLGWDEVVDIGDIHSSMLQENVGLILTLVVTGLQQ